MSTPLPTPTVQGLGPLPIHLKNHCILCLQPESPAILQTIFSTNPSSLLSFQPLIYYLTSIDPSDPSQMSEYLSSQKYFPICTSPSNLPPMCASCYPILGEMYRLHCTLIQIQHQLQIQIQLARKIVKSTVNFEDNSLYRPSPRTNLLQKMGLGLRPLLPPEDLKGLRYFIENFHGLIIQAENENKYKFPSPPPPPPDPRLPPPPPPVSQAALMSLSYPIKFEWPHFHPNHLSFTSTSPAPSASSSSTSTSTNQEVILVSGIDNTVKFEVEGEEEFEDDNFEDEAVNVLIVAKERNDALQDAPQQFIVEPDDYPQEDEDDDDIVILEDGSGDGGRNIGKVDRQPCDICNKILNLTNLPSHLRGHLGRDPVSCDVCSQVFISKSKLISHYLETSSESHCRQRSRWFGNLKYTCELCHGTFFGSEVELRNHVFNLHERDLGLGQEWECNLCKERFRTFEGLDFHTNWHISREQKRTCWERLKQLLSPQPSQSLLVTTPPQLPEMGPSSAYPNARILKRTRKLWPGVGGRGNANGRHANWVDLTCDFCGLQCIGNSALLKHVKQVHKEGGGAKRPRN